MMKYIELIKATAKFLEALIIYLFIMIIVIVISYL